MIIKRLLDFFETPVYHGDSQNRQAFILHKLVIGSFLVVLLTELSSILFLPDNIIRWFLIILFYAGFSVLLIYLNKKAHTVSASYIFLLFILILIGILTWTSGGMRSPTLFVFPVLVMAGGLLFGWRFGIVIGLITISISLLLVIAESENILPVPNVIVKSKGLWITSSASLVLFIYLQYLTVTSLDRAYIKTRKELSLRSETEVELKKSRDQFQSLVNNIPGITYRCLNDNDWTMLYISSEIENFCGYPSSDFINNNVRAFGSLIRTEDNEKVTILINKAILNFKSWEFEYRINHKDGSIKWAFEKGNAVRDHEGNIEYLDGFILDITQRKSAEEEIERYQNHLEKMVQERTEELYAAMEELRSINEELFNQKAELEKTLASLKNAQNQLIHSEKMASIGVLSAGIAHEINNPLNFISGGAMALEAFAEEKLKIHKEEITPMIAAIKTGIKRAADIVSSMSHYSRRDDKVFADCNLHEIIDNCLVIIHNQIKNKAIITRRFTSDSPIIKGSEGKLHQAFLNIISNSGQSIEKRGTIEIRTSRNNRNFEITISDSGCGIPADVITQVFDPFFTTKPPGKGTGLGLYITYNIIRDHNGTIQIESGEGKGSTVTIRLPLS